MYGTIARFRVNPGTEAELRALSSDPEFTRIEGWVSSCVYRMDADPNEFYLAVVFESKEAYLANANTPEQNARFLQLRALMASDPEWHDGEVVDYSTAK